MERKEKARLIMARDDLQKALEVLKGATPSHRIAVGPWVLAALKELDKLLGGETVSLFELSE